MVGSCGGTLAVAMTHNGTLAGMIPMLMVACWSVLLLVIGHMVGRYWCRVTGYVLAAVHRLHAVHWLTLYAYKRRTRRLLLSCLPRQRCRHVLPVGIPQSAT